VNPRRIKAAPSFTEAVRKFPPDQQDRIRDAVKRFRDRSAENALQSAPKTGLNCWAFRVPGVGGARVFYIQRRDDEGRYSLLFHVGPHDDYRIARRRIPK